MRTQTALTVAFLALLSLTTASAAETTTPHVCKQRYLLTAKDYSPKTPCPVANADILYDIIQALRVEQNQPAYLMTTRVMTSLSTDDIGDSFFSNITIGAYRCLLATSPNLSKENAQTFLRPLPLSLLFQSECGASDSKWQDKISSFPSAIRITNIILSQFNSIYSQLSKLNDFHDKMEKRYQGKYFKTADREKNYIATINKLSTMAKELAEATKPFFTHVENFSTERNEHAKWLEALDALIPEHNAKETSFEDYHALLVSILKNPLSLTD
ncbi:exported hypothetical protein [Azospirillaceae bacterium]